MKFAHMSDIHLGAFREPILRKMEREVFEDAVEKCIELKIDFVLICGDIFHVSIPDLSIVNDTIRTLRLLQSANIPVYAIYGSHDYTPTGTSIIDILETAGILTNVMKQRQDDEGRVELEFVVDEKTKAKIAGISARRIGLESTTYEKLDKVRLEAVKGFKIFAFHSGITELKPSFLSEMETIPISNFPKGFDYYAGGHIHVTDEFEQPGYGRIVFPGPLFTGYGKDIEDTARGTKRGFYLVEFDDNSVNHVEFVEVKGFDGCYFAYDASGKNSHQAKRELATKLEELEVNGRVVIVRVRGELEGGKTTDINFVELQRQLYTKGAVYVQFNRFGLSSKEFEANRLAGEDPAQIEFNLFRENIGKVKVSQDNLKGDQGVRSATELLRVTKDGQKTGESKAAYQSRILSSGIETLKLQKEFKKSEVPA
jgi:DNA repair protein SbcD/Mre11